MASNSPPRSRYRRQQQHEIQEPVPTAAPAAPAQAPHNESIARSKSRYHRRPAATSRPAGQPYEQSGKHAGSTAQQSSTPQASPPVQQPSPDVPPPPVLNGTRPSARHASSGAGREQLHHRGWADEPPPAQDTARRVRSDESEQHRMRPEQNVENVRVERRQHGDRKLRKQRSEPFAHHQPGPSQLSLPVTSPKRGGFFSFFRRRKDDRPPQPEMQRHRAPTRPETNHPIDPANIATTPPVESTIKPGGGGVVPGIDAPVSAVNAGDRRVTVECNRSSIQLPVTPDTTPADLLRSAANCLSEPIDLKNAVLLEHFGKVGVKRPLRRYEHVRDVMNSWDTDSSNSLIIKDLPFEGLDGELTLSGAPSQEPAEVSLTLYHSQKVGKWNKRCFTLKSDGQILMSRDEYSIEATNVCHLSDFDIYEPTREKINKKIKPPKKEYCYAVKSQQKSTVFMNQTSFVHFFCTNDKKTARMFFSAVQGWRSWYLVTVKGLGQKRSKPAEPAAAIAQPETTVKRSTSKVARQPSQHKHSTSLDSAYQLGSFKPLLDVNQVGYDDRPATSGHGGPATAAQAVHERKMSTRAKQHPPISGQHRYPSDGAQNGVSTHHHSGSSGTTTESIESGTFAPNGLLGRTYTKRQHAQASREASASQPFIEGPSLLNGARQASGGAYQKPAEPTRPSSSGMPQRMASTRSTRDRRSSDLKRNTSQRQPQKPLVDLTPTYREPPQHAKKGRGYHPDNVGQGGLIEAATSPEQAIQVPPSTDWRNRSGTATNSNTIPDRTRSMRNNMNRPGTSAADAGGFTGTGLLATTAHSQGDIGRGHGVMSGTHAKGPMLDMNEASQFAPGSLLSKVESQKGREAPIIDRES